MMSVSGASLLYLITLGYDISMRYGNMIIIRCLKGASSE
ncbi:hypothetical protein ACP70R_031248 [Stipagrostis hirtigluma subsp. patula]